VLRKREGKKGTVRERVCGEVNVFKEDHFQFVLKGISLLERCFKGTLKTSEKEGGGMGIILTGLINRKRRAQFWLCRRGAERMIGEKGKGKKEVIQGLNVGKKRKRWNWLMKIVEGVGPCIIEGARCS